MQAAGTSLNDSSSGFASAAAVGAADGSDVRADGTKTMAAAGAAMRIHPRRQINPLSPPTTMVLSGVRIHFPFRPNSCQEAYMQTVMNALLKSENALLESPPGSGKTLCLLCACLAWQRHETAMLLHSEQLEYLAAINQTAPAAAAARSASTNVDQPGASGATKPPVEYKRHGAPTIVYASRSQSQLDHVVKELRSTRYRPTHAVLGSREQMCIHPHVNRPTMTESDVHYGCYKLEQKRACPYRNNLDGFMTPSNEYMPSTSSSCCQNGSATAAAAAAAPMHRQQSLRDMEELVAMGKAHSVCPFYYTQSQIENAELILVPYNVLFDKAAREEVMWDTPWDNTVVIFDDAHNLETFCSEAMSFEITSADIAGCIREVQKAINVVAVAFETINNIKLENLVKIKALFLQLEEFILGLGPQTDYDGTFMIQIFQQGCGINHDNHQIFIDEVRKIIDLTMDLRSCGTVSSDAAYPRLVHFIECLERVFGSRLESQCRAKAAYYYRVHVSTDVNCNVTDSTHNGAIPVRRTISYCCMEPALAIEELAAGLKIRSVLVTAGTLSPLSGYGMELGLSFPHVLESPHFLSPKRMHVRVIAKGETGKLLKSSSLNHGKDRDYALELGNTLVSIAEVTPAGMLVFFPSYTVMESCIEEWGGPASSPSSSVSQNDAYRGPSSKATTYSFPLHFASDASTYTTPWKRMLSIKSVVVEPQDAVGLPGAMADFKEFLEMPQSRGCILFGVCGGKISDGMEERMDFPYEKCRAMVIVGLPYPPRFDAKVKMKREFLDCILANNGGNVSGESCFAAPQIAPRISRLSGYEWYIQQARRTVNISIGRLIRYQKDCSVLLLDSRFDQSHNHAGLSKWLRSNIINDEGLGAALRGLDSFYKNAEEHVKPTEQRAALPSTMVDHGAAPLEKEPPSKVAIVCVSQDEREEAAKEYQDTCVSPSDVVTRLDVKDQVQTHQPENPVAALPTVTDNKGATSLNCAVFETSKNLAIRFMEKVKKNLKKSDQSTIRTAIVAMTEAGERRDMQSYLNGAKDVVALVNRCEPFETPTVRESKMLLVFFGLLPNHYHKRVETMSFEMVFDVSSLGSLIRERLESEYDSLRLATAHLLQTLWCRSSDVPLPCDLYLHEAKGVLEKLPITEKSVSSSLALSSYLKLVPTEYHALTHAWAAGKISALNEQGIKVADKLKAGDAVNTVLLPSIFDSTKSCSKQSSPDISATNSSRHVTKRKLAEPLVVPESLIQTQSEVCVEQQGDQVTQKRIKTCAPLQSSPCARAFRG